MSSITINYSEIFDSFRGTVKDYDLAELCENDSDEIMQEWLHKSFSNMFIHRLFLTFSFDDEIRTITFSMKKSIDDNIDKEFVINVMSKQMVYEWAHPQVRSKENTAQFYGGKEQSFYSQANHLTALMNLETEVMADVRRLIRDRGYVYNGYLEG